MTLQVRALIVAGLLASAGLAGCHTSDEYYNQRQSADTTKKADAPKPADKPVAKAPVGGNVMYYPTGVRETSALALERTAPSEVNVGQEFAYEYKLTNLTSMDLREVMLKDACASGFQIVGSDPKAMGSGQDLTWNIGSLAPGQSKTVKVNGKATATTGVLTSCAQVSYNSLLCVTTNVVQPALKVAVSAPDLKTSCEEVCVKITVTNTGTGLARNTRVTYNVPAGWTAKGATQFDAGNLAAGESKEATVCLTPGKTGTFNSQANAVAEGNLSAASNTAVTAIKQPKLEIAAECPGSTLIGRNMTFKFTVKNSGDFVSANTIVNAPLPAGTTFGSADMGGVATATGISWNLGDLAAGASKTVSYTVRNTGAGSVAASASVVGTCAPQVAANCSTSVLGVPDIGTLLTDDDGVVLVGDNHVFRYEVKNQGQIDLTNLKVVFKFDDGLDFVSSTSTTAPKASGKTVEFNLGTLKTGDKLSFTITGKGTKEGNLVLNAVTSANETKRVNSNDEQVNYIPR